MMLEKIIASGAQKNHEQKFSILIPSWNNIDYLKHCLKSIEVNSAYNHQIIIIINEGSDGTYSWLKSQKKYDFVYSPNNIGICYGLNACRALVTTDYILYLNDDMYVLPNWDKALLDEINEIGHKEFMLSATMIEPHYTNNKSVIVADYGDDLESFQEEKLLKKFMTFEKKDWSGSTWPPNVLHVDLWDLVGGMSVEFSPGMYSDPDFSMKLWKSGVRLFKGVANSRVYHFGSKSTGRVKKNKGKETFINKWGVNPSTFTNKYLKRGEDYDGPLEDYFPSSSDKLKVKFKKLF
mgnify:FL=1